MRITAALTLALLIFGSAPALRAQSLGDVARKEEERRKTKKNPAKVYTNSDLKPAAPPALLDAPAPDSKKPAATSGSDPAKPADAAKVVDPGKAADVKVDAADRGEKFWSTRMRDAREQLERDRVLADALQSRVNALTTDFVNRDDPAQRALIGADRQKSIAEMERLRKAVEVDQKTLTALEEEARRTGVPPGWLR